MRSFVAALLLLLCAACSTFEPAPPPPDPKTVMPALEQRIAVMIAEARGRTDPKAHFLMLDPELSAIARQRAADMAEKNYVAHTAPNGDTSATLLMAEDAHFQGILGENIAAQHYQKAVGVDVEGFARRFVDTWMASAPHKENLAFPDYNKTGVGAAVNGDTVYVTQLFSTDLGLGPHPDDPVPPVITPVPSPQAGLTPRPKPEAALRGSQGTH
ncbi:MAG TPA: CAP domain-containing protein [Rhizomicrobium sp.]